MGVRVNTKTVHEAVVRLDVYDAVCHESFADAGLTIGNKDRFGRNVEIIPANQAEEE